MASLRSYIETARRLTGARTASLLIDPLSRTGFSAVLLSVGEHIPMPGLETPEDALQVVADLRLSGPGVPMSHPSPALRHYSGVSYDIHFLRINVSETDAPGASPRNERLSIERRRHPPGKTADRPEGEVWIALRCDSSEAPVILCAASDVQGVRSNGESLSVPEWLGHVLVSGARMAWQVYELSTLLKDPITGLPRRSELPAQIRHASTEAAQDSGSFALALINPDEFEQVNQRLGRENGDLVLREIANLLEDVTRLSDSVFHYGGAVFAVLIWLAGDAETGPAASRLRKTLSRRPFLEGEVRLDFSIGVSRYGTDAENGQQLDADAMLQRADSALNAAKAAGGAQTVLWAPRGCETAEGNRDRLSGMYTADTRKDYRNMLLLWETVQVISSRADTAAIATEFVERVTRTFKPRRAMLISAGKDGQSRLPSIARGVSRGPYKEAGGDVALLLSEDQRRLVAGAERTRETASAPVLAPDPGNSGRQSLMAYAVPLLGGDKYLGSLYVDGPEESFQLDSSDLMFLAVLSKQVAVALDRSELALSWKREKERESLQLREEVRELRQVLHHSRLVYKSSRMRELLGLLRKVAPTDATVLISGESGTGKEMIARFAHEQSVRRKGPLVTVDCGAIAPSLIEAELFGHAKGAYTGASGSSQGRIARAEGGTVFLDEIGELPLEVQARLLRFVQEREITPVGASRPQKIDARIVAATNRNLAAEVDAGRFRRDLYYRLQVVSVTVPPLRERPDDILPLALYFLENFAAQYEKGVRHLSAEAEIALLGHSWPGNVRELQNRLLQAVIMSGEEELRRTDLLISADATAEDHCIQAPTGQPATCVQGSAPTPQLPSLPPTPDRVPGDFRAPDLPGDCDPWDALRSALDWQVEAAIHYRDGVPNALGVWLTEDLVLAADEAHKGVSRQAAEAIGMAETTFRRQLEKAKRAVQLGMASRSSHWSYARPFIQHLIGSANGRQEDNLVLAARQLLLAEVVSRLSENDPLGAALMGVTTPTYRRWCEERSSVGAP